MGRLCCSPCTHSLPHSVVVARLDHLGYQLKEGVMEAVRSEVVGIAIPV